MYYFFLSSGLIRERRKYSSLEKKIREMEGLIVKVMEIFENRLWKTTSETDADELDGRQHCTDPTDHRTVLQHPFCKDTVHASRKCSLWRRSQWSTPDLRSTLCMQPGSKSGAFSRAHPSISSMQHESGMVVKVSQSEELVTPQHSNSWK